MKLWICCFVICTTHFVSITSISPSDVVVATYNLWNIMFHWNIRKNYIAEMIKDVHADIIGFQEVRATKDLKHTQLDELQMLLPEFRYKAFIPVQYTNKKHYHPGWEWEGIGFLSRHEMLRKVSFNLTTPYDSTDKNQRSFMHIQFLLARKSVEINVILVHISYDKRSQCSNMYELIKYIYTIGIENVVVIGDFNVYDHFLTPIKALSNGYFETDTLCEDIGEMFTQSEYKAINYKFVDAWVEVNPHIPGYTFSNMPVPGLINRPDRILVSTIGIKIVSALILGKGEFYKHKYRHQIYMDRYKRILQAAQEGKMNRDQNSTCQMDCGPNGSCRCGICISGGDKNNCAPEKCSECSAFKLSQLYLIIVAIMPSLLYNSLLFVLLLLGIFQPGTRRCLMNRLRLRRFTNWTVIMVINIILVLFFFYAYYEFSDVSRLVNLQMLEETYPSDHLMVVARLNVD